MTVEKKSPGATRFEECMEKDSVHHFCNYVYDNINCLHFFIHIVLDCFLLLVHCPDIVGGPFPTGIVVDNSFVLRYLCRR